MPAAEMGALGLNEHLSRKRLQRPDGKINDSREAAQGRFNAGVRVRPQMYQLSLLWQNEGSEGSGASFPDQP